MKAFRSSRLLDGNILFQGMDTNEFYDYQAGGNLTLPSM